MDIQDRIVISGQFRASNPQIAPLLAPFGVNAAQFFTNAIDTETIGADVVVSYSRALDDVSALSITGAANWNFTEVVGGLSRGDRVVISLDSPDIKDGAEAVLADEEDDR